LEKGQKPPGRSDSQASIDKLRPPEIDAADKDVRELNATPLEKFCETRVFETAHDLFRYLREGPFLERKKWVFRGQVRASWNLKSSLERHRRQPEITMNDAEDYVQRTFKRRAHHFVRTVPNEGERLEWWALMRRHGAPTRLLDWTKSPYVAAYFATAGADPNEPSAVWAINANALWEEVNRMIPDAKLREESRIIDDYSLRDPAAFDKLMSHSNREAAVVVPVEPRIMSAWFRNRDCFSAPTLSSGILSSG
jgi:hypothetical protein